jgi:hypothetical protein
MIELSPIFIGYHNIQLAPACTLIEFGNMKTQKSIHANHIPRLLLTVPVICSMAFAASSSVAGTARTHRVVNLQTSLVGERQASDNVTIGARTYNSESRSFDRPWPFGPESGAQ